MTTAILAHLQPGDVVALWGASDPAWVATAEAVWSRGGAILPLPPRWTNVEAQQVLGRALPKLVVGTPELAGRARALRLPACAFGDLDLAGVAPLADLPADRLAALMPTSGTTGTPKLACLTAAGLAATAAATAEALGIDGDSVYWLPIPLHHVGGLGAVARTRHAGASLVVSKDAPEAFTHASLVPTQLVDHPGGWPAGLKAVMVGGAAPPPDLLAKCPAARATYGLTEAGGTVTLSRPGDVAGSSGWALPGYALAVRDDDGRDLPVGEVGGIWVSGPGLMRGYLDTPSPIEGGWLRTGDLGHLDAEGRLFVLARRDDLIVSGGENVYPMEVEAALLQHPDVLEAAVVGVPDARWGHVVMAYMVARPGAPEVAPEALRAHLEGRLARFKHPRRVQWISALPRLAAGKVDRRALRDRV